MWKIPSNSPALCFTVIFRTSSGKIKVNDIKVWTYFGNQSHESVRERQKRARKVSPNPITREHFRALDQSTGSNFANQKLIFHLQNSCLDPPHSSITLPADMLWPELFTWLCARKQTKKYNKQMQQINNQTMKHNQKDTRNKCNRHNKQTNQPFHATFGRKGVQVWVLNFWKLSVLLFVVL